MRNDVFKSVGLYPEITLIPIADDERLSIEERIRLHYVGAYIREHPNKVVLHRPFIVNKAKYYIHSIQRAESICDGPLSGEFRSYRISLKCGPEKNRKKFIKAIRLTIDMDQALA